MGELAGKGLRVGGLFVAMLGAGLVLESAQVRLGIAVLVLGLAVFAAGFARRRNSAGLGESGAA